MKHDNTLTGFTLLAVAFLTGFLQAAGPAQSPAIKESPPTPRETVCDANIVRAIPGKRDPNQLYTLKGEDPPIQDIIDRGTITPGERFGKGSAPGARVVVNHKLLEQLTGKLPPLDERNISGIQHSAGHGSRRNFPDWARFYQEDGNTQVFRLHKGDWQFRDGPLKDARAGRIEAYTNKMAVTPGTWLEWEGTFTIIKPHGAVIFQLFHEGGQLWAFHLGMSHDGDITFNRRRNESGKEKQMILGRQMVGRPLSIRIRSNAQDFEIYAKQPLIDKDWKPVTDGSYQRGKDDKVQFRWGMYLGQTRNKPVEHDAMYFVTGTTIRMVANHNKQP